MSDIAKINEDSINRFFLNDFFKEVIINVFTPTKNDTLKIPLLISVILFFSISDEPIYSLDCKKIIKYKFSNIKNPIGLIIESKLLL